VLGDRPAVHPRQPGQQARMNAPARRRGSTRPNRPPTRSISSSNSRRQPSKSTLRPAAIARLSVVHTPSDHRSGGRVTSTATLRAVTKCRWSIRRSKSIGPNGHASIGPQMAAASPRQGKKRFLSEVDAVPRGSGQTRRRPTQLATSLRAMDRMLPYRGRRKYP
jgi:hypothetical protein